MSKKRVGLFFGGRSGEHEVSLQSAASVYGALLSGGFEVTAVGITREGRWLIPDDPEQAMNKGLAAVAGRRVTLKPEPSAAGQAQLDCTGEAESFPIDVAFPVLHGPYGEDGTIQALFKMAGIPFVGAGVASSAVSMDKILMKAVLRDAGLPVVDGLAFTRYQLLERHPSQGAQAQESTDAPAMRIAPAVIERVENKLGYPCFVKPANLGSSVGVNKAHERQELVQAMITALDYDRRILVEAAVEPVRELECGVLGHDEPRASAVGEIVPAREFYDYESKYEDNSTRLIIPAQIPGEMVETVQRLALEVFKQVDAAGMARVDFFVQGDQQKTGRIYVNELNTLPGFTRVSMYPKLWETTGLPYPALVSRLIDLAFEANEGRQRYGKR